MAAFRPLPFGLAPGIHATRIGERFVVLDRPRDEYSLLVGPAAEALAALFEQGSAGPALDGLVDAGLLAPGSPRGPAAIAPATRELAAGRGPARGRARAGAALALTAARLRLGGVDAACRWLEARPEGVRDHRVAAALVAAFAAVRPWYPQPPRCLLDSLALLCLLRGSGIAARAVVGVRLDPFGAHCWVEVDGAVANNRLEVIAGFVPIMAV